MLTRACDFINKEKNLYQGKFIFILGAGRSGNTLLRRLLVERYAIYIPAETYVIPDALAGFNKTKGLDWPIRVRMVLSAFEYQKEFPNISQRSLFPVFESCCGLAAERQTFGDILYVLWEYLAEGAGVSHVLPGDKTPLNTFSINMIARAFPRGLFLFITRHPFDVCVSYLKMGRYNTPEEAAQRWLAAHENWLVFDKFYDRKSMLVRYEELVQNPSVVIGKMGAWLDVPERQDAIASHMFWGDMDVYAHISNAKADVTDASIGKGARALDRKDREVIRKIVGQTAHKFGYDI